MMTPNNYTSPTTRKEAQSLSKSAQSSTQGSGGSASFLAGEDQSRLEQDKRSIYK